MTKKNYNDNLPGDLNKKQVIDRMLRVDHAGEYGAVRIYEGQLAVLGKTDKADTIKHMVEQEQEHLSTFNDLVIKNRVRPTLMLPIWHIAGYALGVGTALMGKRAAMACTVAVEEVIDEHYASQIDSLSEEDDDLCEIFEKFRQEEIEHKNTGIENEAELTLGYPFLKGAIKKGSRFAIWLSERI